MLGSTSADYEVGTATVTDIRGGLQYWDSCLFINFLTRQDQEKADTVAALIERARRETFRILVSTLVIAEVRPSDEYSQASREIVEEIFATNRPYIQFAAPTRSIATRARELGAENRQLTVPDCIHLATAMELEADVFFTWDGDRDNVLRRSRGLLRFDRQLGNPPLPIQVPTFSYGPLFDQTSGPAQSP
jgi:predicted nucleic acid-binding protein